MLFRILPGVCRTFFSLNYITALEEPDLCVGATEEIWNSILGYRRLVQFNKYLIVLAQMVLSLEEELQQRGHSKESQLPL